MDVLSEFPGEFFKAVELAGRRLPLTISGIEKRVMNDGKAKPVLLFEEDERALVLNVENRTTLVGQFGRETDDWIGKKVTLITRVVQGPSGPCQGIRFADAPVGELIDDELPPSMADKPKKKRAFK